MQYEKSKYEELITDSPLFQLDRETESVAFRRERYKMIEYLYCYLLAINEAAYEPYGCEIYEVAARCIDNYDSDKGVFLYYFISAWKIEYRHIGGDEALETRYHGFQIGEDDKRSLKKYFKYLETSDPNISCSELCRKFAEKCGISVEEAARIAVIAGVYATGTEITDSEGNVTRIFDQIPTAQDVEAEYLFGDYVMKAFDGIEWTFLSLQNRQQPIISDMMTIRICPIIIEQRIDYGMYSFINDEIVLQYLNTGCVPSQRNIAEKHDRNEASISRSVKEFLQKLRVALNN